MGLKLKTKLSPSTLKAELIEIEKEAIGFEAYDSASDAIDSKCEAIANAIDAYVKSVINNNVKVMVPAGIYSLPAGPAPAPGPQVDCIVKAT